MKRRFIRGIIRDVGIYLLISSWVGITSTGALYAQGQNSQFGEASNAKGEPAAKASALSANVSSIRNLGNRVNSRYDDLNPIVTADGSTIYFARKYSINNTGGKLDPQDIWFTSLVHGQWTESKNLGPEVNTPKADNLCAVSADNTTFYFFVQTGKHKGYFGLRRKTSSGWTKIQSTGLEIENESPFLEASLSMNGTAFFFTARTRQNLHYNSAEDERDIYVSLKQSDGTWGRPINLGPSINSRGDEYSPFLAADGRTLYFSSNGRAGIGGVDIYMARRTGSGWTEWTQPRNLGPEINTTGFDGYLSVPASGDVAYLATSGHSLGKADLVRAVLPADLRPEKVTIINAQILHAQTGEPLNVCASVNIQETGISPFAFRAYGNFLYAVRPGREVVIEVVAPGFQPAQRTVKMTQEESSVATNFELDPADDVPYFPMNPILFDEGKAELTPTARLVLDSLKTYLAEHPTIKLRVEGYTDNRGLRKSLYALSRKRVQVVHRYLVENGIDSKRIDRKALGPSFPVADNTDAEMRSMNRRVEIRLILH